MAAPMLRAPEASSRSSAAAGSLVPPAPPAASTLLEHRQKTPYHDQVSLQARFSRRIIQQTSSRFSFPSFAAAAAPAAPKAPAAPPTISRALKRPEHAALAATLTAAAARQQRRQQQQQKQQHARHGSGWSADLLRDLQGVCQEVGLPQAAARSLAAAAARRRVSANPGVLLSQLVRLMPVASSLGGPASLAALVSRSPALLLSDPDTLLTNLAAARQMLGQHTADALALRHPQLLTCSPFRLQSNLQQLQMLLGCRDAAAAAAVAARKPLLLLSAPQGLRSRLQALQQLLPAVPGPKLLRQVLKTPELLLLRPSTMAAKLQCLDRLFQQSSSSRVASSSRQASQHQVVPLRQGRQLTGPHRLSVLQHHRQQRHLTPGSSPGATAAAASSSSSSSGAAVVDARVQHLMLKVPALLSMGVESLQAHVTELQLLLGLQPGDPQLQRIIQLQPGLLTQSPATLANKLQLLQHLTGRPEGEARQMALQCPAVLTLSASSVTGKWQLLGSCVRACGAWQQQLAGAAPVTVAMLLCYSSQRLQRLRYVVAAAQEAEAAGCAAVPGGGNPPPGARRRRRHRSSSCSHCSGSGRLQETAAAATEPAVGGAASRAASEALDRQLRKVAWRSLVQLSDQQFASRCPGYAAWQQQQQQQQEEGQLATMDDDAVL